MHLVGFDLASLMMIPRMMTMDWSSTANLKVKIASLSHCHILGSQIHLFREKCTINLLIGYNGLFLMLSVTHQQVSIILFVTIIKTVTILVCMYG